MKNRSDAMASRWALSSSRARPRRAGPSKGTVDLYASSAQPLSKSYPGLTSKSHRIVIQVTGTKGAASAGTNVAVDAFAVGKAATQDDSPRVQYDVWSGSVSTSASGGSYRSAGKAGATASLAFTGTSVTWVTATGPSFGDAQVYIDGVAQGAVVDLYSATPHWQAEFTFSGLASGGTRYPYGRSGRRTRPQRGHG